MMWHGFPLWLWAIIISITPVELNLDFTVCMIPKLEWVALLEATDTLHVLEVTKGPFRRIRVMGNFRGRWTMCCWRCLCWTEPCNAPACLWVIRNGDSTVPDAKCLFCDHMYLYLPMCCLLLQSCVSLTLDPVIHQTQCSWAQYYLFSSLKVQNQNQTQTNGRFFPHDCLFPNSQFSKLNGILGFCQDSSRNEYFLYHKT